MSTSSNKTVIKKLTVEDKLYIYLSSGDILAIPYSYTARLKDADKSKLSNYRLIGGGVGIHFPDIDEDISLAGIIEYKLSHELLAS